MKIFPTILVAAEFLTISHSMDEISPQTYYELGEKYTKGNDVPIDHHLAFKNYEQGALKGHAQCAFMVGAIYQEGKGVTKDMEKSLEWYKKSVALGYDLAVFFVAMHEYNSKYTLEEKDYILKQPQDLQLAKEAEGFYNLGEKYSKGDGVPMDNSLAFVNYEQGALMGNAQCSYMMGALYIEGKGVEKNTDKGTEWLKKSASQGYELAHFQIAAHEYQDKYKSGVQTEHLLK